MADPHHIEALDGLDRLTVRLYRAGLLLAAVAVAAAAAESLLGRAPRAATWALLAVGTGLAVGNLHLYDKRVRWLITAFGWAGVLLLVAGGALGVPLVFEAGIGFLFAALSGFALKEQFCFRIPGLRFVPLFLAVSLVPMVAGALVAEGVLLAVAGLLLLLLAVAKLRMPLTHDIGDKSRYQI